jgi:hypothetical protein
LVYFAYVDESFNKKNFVLGSMLVEPDDVHALSVKLDELAATAAWDYKLPHDVEFHGYEMFHGEQSWSPMKQQVRARIGVYRKMIDIILAHRVIFIFQCIAEEPLRERQARTAYPENFSSSQVAWSFLLQKISQHAIDRETQTLVIADEIAEDEARRRALADYRRSGTPGSYLKSKLPGILDTIHFAPSKHSRLLQAIDCMLFIYLRRRNRIDKDPRAIKTLDEIHDQMIAAKVIREYHVWP